MFKLNSIIISGLLSFLLAASAFAQTAPVKVAYIDTAAFYDEKVGITKLVAASKQLNGEFAVRIKELEDGGIRLQNISKEIETMQKLPSAQFNQTSYNTKRDEGERLQRELTYKKTDLESAIEKRRQVLFGPIQQDISKAIDEYAKKNGYGLIWDIGKFVQAGALLFFAEAADSTKDFITFYNSRAPK